jgi:hypothetical protein
LIIRRIPKKYSGFWSYRDFNRYNASDQIGTNLSENQNA